MAWRNIIYQKVDKQTIFIYNRYLKTAKLRYWFIAANTQKYDKREV